MPARQLITALIAVGSAFGVPAGNPRPVRPPILHRAPPARAIDFAVDTLLGASGKLRARFLPVTQARELSRLLESLRVSDAEGGLLTRVASMHVLPIVPFGFKVRGRVGSYRMGYWPGEPASYISGAYDLPEGFIMVTPANRDLRVSEHFRLRDFVTKDQADVWPKYVVLREVLLDKLELVIEQLRVDGHPVQGLKVMSGFRHPFYNMQGVGAGGRALDSRHIHGDAADVFVDDDGDGVMDDLDGDGRITVKDGDVIVAAVEQVERAYPWLTGGMGRYTETHAHGPFVHIDVRGRPVRWGGA